MSINYVHNAKISSNHQQARVNNYGYLSYLQALSSAELKQSRCDTDQALIQQKILLSVQTISWGRVPLRLHNILCVQDSPFFIVP